jgi:hypothetical protein
MSEKGRRPTAEARALPGLVDAALRPTEACVGQRLMTDAKTVVFVGDVHGHHDMMVAAVTRWQEAAGRSLPSYGAPPARTGGSRSFPNEEKGALLLRSRE